MANNKGISADVILAEWLCLQKPAAVGTVLLSFGPLFYAFSL